MIGRHEGKLSACVSLSLGHNILYNSIEGFAIVLKDADKKIPFIPFFAGNF